MKRLWEDSAKPPWQEEWHSRGDDRVCRHDHGERQTIGHFLEDVDDIHVARADLAAAAPDLARALLAVEWGSAHWSGQCCPECDSLKREGHTKDCALDAALKKSGVR